MSAVSGSKAGSIRRRLGVLLATVGALVSGLLVLTTFQLRASNAQAHAENRRNRSFQIADSMRQSSNDLTHMVRLYVATGEPRYRSYYQEILAIRAGTAPRPLHYDSSFWDRVLAEGNASVEYGRPESLVDEMRAAKFKPDEFAALNASLEASNHLARLELDVMDRVAPRIAQGVDAAYFSDVASQYQRLVDPAYLAEKGVIMGAIGDFIARVEGRTANAVERARSTSHRLGLAQLAILGLIVLVGLAAMIRARRVVLRPLADLAVATDQFAAGNYRKRVAVSGAAEIDTLASAFNTMAAAVQSDVSRRELAERDALDARIAAEEANRAKSTFVAAMSHEIRTPMIGVVGMLEVLAQTDLTPDQRSMVSTAQGSAQVLLQIIGDILDFSKIEAGKLELAPAPFTVGSVANATVQTFFHTASAKGLPLSCSIDDAVAPAHVGDALRIRQILSNFISNAVKFTPSGGINLAVRVLDDDGATQSLEFSVADTGIGVAPDKQRDLFHDFTQADATTASRSGGTGLGLVICRRLATLMNGDVRMVSTPGRGTTMYLTVPLRVADVRDVEASEGTVLGAAPLVSKRPKPPRDVAERERSVVLLAEDHPINRRVLVHQLGIIGFHVDTADDGQEAFELFVGGRYGVVLTDLNMPMMDGFELAQAIRAHEADARLAPTPIVALSANVLPGEADRCRAAGMDDFLGKPAPMLALAEKLRRWLPEVVWTDADGGDPSGAPATDGTAPDPDGVLDPAALDELTGGDAGLAAAILVDYVESLRGDLDTLAAAVAGGSRDDIRRHVHRIHGASRTVGAEQVATLAARLEAAATGGSDDWDTMRSTADDLDVALSRVAAVVDRRTPAHSPLA
jgi:signal transduction histidine kinase/CheY-like chemotaxis protein/HPt (histidine-containing phosphotransfer) domain-containing protein